MLSRSFTSQGSEKAKKEDNFQVAASLVGTQARIGDIVCMTYVSQDPLICIISFRQGHNGAFVFEDRGKGTCSSFVVPVEENKREILVSRGLHSSNLI